MALPQRFSQQIAPLLRAIRRSGAVLTERMARVAKAFRHRRDLECLARLDDRMLADIGLTRSDLRFALSEPFWRDPGAVLVSRAGERGTKHSRATSVPSIVPVFTDRAGRRFAAAGDAARRAA